MPPAIDNRLAASHETTAFCYIERGAMNANRRVLSACALLALAAMAGAGRGSENVDPARAPWAAAQAPWASTAKPGDAVKDHVELITDGRHAYTVVQSGTIDGRSCRSPMGVGMNMEGALEQTWESNRAVRIENLGDTNVINPWLSNGHNDFRTVKEIVESAVKPGMTDAEKAMGHLVAGLPPPLPRRAQGDDEHGPREDLQRLRLLRVRVERHRAGRALARGRAAGRPPRPGRSATRPRASSSTAAGATWTATSTASSCCATTRRWPTTRTWCATMTW